MQKPGMRSVLVQGVSGTTVAVYRLGATVNVESELDVNQQDTVQIPVFDTGRIAVGDSLQSGTDDSTEMLVTAVASDGTSVTVQGISDGATRLEKGSRLILLTNRPTLYNEGQGAWATLGP